MRCLLVLMLILFAVPAFADPAVHPIQIDVKVVQDGWLVDNPDEDSAYTEALQRLETPIRIGPDVLELGDLLKSIRDQTGLKFSVNWPTCEIPGVDRESWVELDLEDVSAATVLSMALEQVSAMAFDDDKLGYCVRDDIVYISTRFEIKAITETRVYNLTPLMVEPLRPVGLIHEEDAFSDTIAFHAWRRGQRAYPFTDPVRLEVYKRQVEQMQDELEDLIRRHELEEGRGAGPQGVPRGGIFAADEVELRYGDIYREEMEDLIELIQDTVGDQDTWLDDESSIREVSGRFVIQTTRENHHEIEALLNALLELEVEDQADILRDAQVMQLLNRASELQLDGDIEGALEITDLALLIDPNHITARALHRVLSETVERINAQDAAE
ncbi:MAG: hypothetical protein AAGA29_05185 [Planctomycetota bacterium]